MAYHRTENALLILALIFGASCSGSTRTVAKVGDKKITVADVTSMAQFGKDNFDQVLVSTEGNRIAHLRRSLERLIQESILLAEARHLGFSLSEQEFKKGLIRFGLEIEDLKKSLRERGLDPDRWMERQRNRMLIDKLIQQEVIDRIPISDEAISTYYQKNSETFSRPPRYRVRQLVVSDREQAEQLREKMKAGEEFAELAKTFSTSPDKNRGGDIGWFDTDTVPQHFIDAVKHLNIGETSAVLATEHGYHLFQLIDRRPARQASLSEVQEKIVARLRTEQSKHAYQQWFTILAAQTPVVIYEDVLEEAS